MPRPIRVRPFGALLPLVWALLSVPTAAVGQPGQHPAGPAGWHAAADSAAAARRHYQEAVGQLRAGNLLTGKELATRAWQAWPSQPAYPAAVASLAARSGDTALAAAALSALADLGASHPVDRDPAFESLRDAGAIQDAVARMRRATGPLVRSQSVATVGPADVFPEGVARGPDGTFYLGSIRQGRVLRRTPDGQESDLLPPSERRGSVSGVALAPDRASLWITSSEMPQFERFDSTRDGRAELVQVDLAGGVMRRVPIPAAGGVLLGDLLVHPDGGVYASDTRGQAIWYLAPGASAPRIVARDPLLRSPQGMVLAADGRRLLVADYSHGILRVDPLAGRVEHLGAPAGWTLLGIDGLARHGPDLIGIQNGGVVPRVVRIRLDGGEDQVVAVEVLDRNTGVADEPTLGVVDGDHLYYIANSQWEKRDDQGLPRPGVTLVPAILLRLPLR